MRRPRRGRQQGKTKGNGQKEPLTRFQHMPSHAPGWKEQLVVITRKRKRVFVEAHSVSAQIVTFLCGD